MANIIQAFRISNNNDLPSNLTITSRDALLLPDVLTEGDNLEMPPLPDASFLFSQLEDEDTLNTPRKRRAGSRDINLEETLNQSQYLQATPNKGFNDEDIVLEDDLGLELDFGEDLDMSVEVGRDAPAARELGDDIGDTNLDIFGKKNDDTTLLGRNDRRGSVQVSVLGDDDGFRLNLDEDGDIAMGLGDDTLTFPHEDTTLLGNNNNAVNPTRQRISESPLSDIDPELTARMDDFSLLAADQSAFNPGEELNEESVFRAPAQRARKLKLLKPDGETMISSSVIKAQQQDRSKILQKESFLPRNPITFALQEMSRSGGFVDEVLNDARSFTWAPELRGLLSLDAIVSANKRKRDSGVSDLGTDQEDAHHNKSPRLQLDLNFGEHTDEYGNVTVTEAFGRNAIDEVPADGTIIELPAHEEAEGFQLQFDEDDTNVSRPESRGRSVEVEGEMGGEGDVTNGFDTTTAPLVHPADSGPVSLGTKHAVHMLRERFGTEAEHDNQARKKASVIFQDLLPEERTSKADATKMFFEILVLATKDAVKVEQKDKEIGSSIRVRGKRGLWGAWAEREAGGELEKELGDMNSALAQARAVAA